MKVTDIKCSLDFIKFMEEIWEMKSVPTPDGGMTLYQHPDYHAYHNAISVARMLGLHRTGGGGKGDFIVFRWPNNDGVRIAPDGGALNGVASRFSPRLVK